MTWYAYPPPPPPLYVADTNCSCNSAEKKTKALLHSGSVTSEDIVERLFNRLKPIQPAFLIGAWNGGSIDTGHPGHKHLQKMRWAGKTFRSINDADPIVTFDDHGHRVWKEEYGHASVGSRNIQCFGKEYTDYSCNRCAKWSSAVWFLLR